MYSLIFPDALHKLFQDQHQLQVAKFVSVMHHPTDQASVWPSIWRGSVVTSVDRISAAAAKYTR